MTASTVLTAGQLRERFKAIPETDRQANQDFCIRLWRAISWVERAEAAGADDLEGQFIPLWIAFNSLYGRAAEDGSTVPDHAGWQAFLAAIVKADGEDRLGKILWDEQRHVLKTIDSPYLFKPFWMGEQKDADGKLQQARRRALANFRERASVSLLQELFERVYVLRQQVFHGAATCGSKVNRRILKMGVTVLAIVVPAMIEIMVAAGAAWDWGMVCFPPVDQPESRHE